MANTFSFQRNIDDQLRSYKKKFYFNQFIKGFFLFAIITGISYLVISFTEYSLQSGTIFRAFLFFSFLGLFLYCLVRLVLLPLFRLFSEQHQMSNEDAARQIGTFFPEIQDRLLNVIQLNANLQTSDNQLVKATISQRTQELSIFSFPNAIDLKKNLHFLQYLLPLFLITGLIAFLIPQFFSTSSERLINFNKSYAPVAPFDFNVTNEELLAFRNEDFTLDVSIEGSLVPDKAYLDIAGRSIKLKSNGNGSFTHTFQNLQGNLDFRVKAAGYFSKDYDVRVVDRPNLKDFSVLLNYPSYLQLENERLNNVGNLQIPEGTEINWQFNTIASDSMQINFEEDTVYSINAGENGIYKFSRISDRSEEYEISLLNTYSKNKQPINYFIDVIEDEFPKVTLDQLQDTTLFRYLVLGGNLRDDHGISRVSLFYKVSGKEDYEALPISFNPDQNTQSFFYEWNTDSLNLEESASLSYFIKVWDNDGVNGPKSTSTPVYNFRVPSKAEIQEQLDESSREAESKIDETTDKAREINQELKDIQERLKGKKNLEWQDKRRIEDLLKKRQQLEEEIKKLEELSKMNNMKREQFSPQDKALEEKVEQLQNLMEELMDEETRKMYDELQELMKEYSDIEQIQEKLEKINQKEVNLEEELERTLELFKRMKYENKLSEVNNNLEENIKKQEELNNKTQERGKKDDLQDLAEEQEENQKQFEELEKQMEELQEINKDLKNPNAIQDLNEEQKNIKQEQQKAGENLKQNKLKDAKKSQQNATQQMKKMAEKLKQMQQSSEMQMMSENLDNLRSILDNLVTLSFNQEQVMQSFREVKQNDPRFIDLSQEQLKLIDDAQIIEDSLLALAERVFQIQPIVTRNVKKMNEYMDQSIGALRERQQFKAISKQQFSMTSINNLALLLSDVLQQMQMQMAEAMGNPQPNQQNNQNAPSMSELQQQLNQQIQQLKRSGKQGKALSQKLAELAAQQEKIRKALQEKLKQMNDPNAQEKGGKGTGDELMEMMEETEKDIVNKKLNGETIKRQQDIITRLLEVEKSIRERELDDERKGETAKDDYEQEFNKSFEEYIRSKEKEIEMLKTVPLQLNPYFKKEATEYFKRIN
jgi:hypothetical protein